MDEYFEFFFAGEAVGYFLDAYPESPGTYRYEPYRGPGHLWMQEEIDRKGVAQCSYKSASGEHTFLARRTPGPHALAVEGCSRVSSTTSR